jgi:hypothetical protein
MRACFGILLGFLVFGSQGCAYLVVSSLTESQNWVKEKETKFKKAEKSIRSAKATLAGLKQFDPSIRIWRFVDAPVWLRESSENGPLWIGNDSAKIFSGFKPAPIHQGIKKDSLEVVFFPSENQEFPAPYFLDEDERRIALFRRKYMDEDWTPGSAIIGRNGVLTSIGVEIKNREQYNPFVVTRILLLPAVAIDILLSPIYVLVILFGGSDLMR